MDAVSASVQGAGGTTSTMAGNTTSAAATNNDLSQYAQVIQQLYPYNNVVSFNLLFFLYLYIYMNNFFLLNIKISHK